MGEAGEVGEIHHFRGRYLQEWGSTTADAWRFRIDEAGSGAVDEARPAAEVIVALAPAIIDSVFRWTGHFPEKTRALLIYLEGRARALELAGTVARAAVPLTALVTALAMNHVVKGRYLP